MSEKREALAEYAHEAWSGWMKYLFSKGESDIETGNFILPAYFFERWSRQMTTPYADLPENEKESDRLEADRMWEIVDRTIEVAPPAMGWECPRCHTINAPSAAKCVCMAPSQTTTTGNTYTLTCEDVGCKCGEGK